MSEDRKFIVMFTLFILCLLAFIYETIKHEKNCDALPEVTYTIELHYLSGETRVISVRQKANTSFRIRQDRGYLPALEYENNCAGPFKLRETLGSIRFKILHIKTL